MSEATAPPERVRQQSIFSDHPAQARIDALEALLMLLTARGAIHATTEQLAAIEESLLGHSEKLRDSDFGHEMSRLLRTMKKLTVERRGAAG